MRHHFGQFKFEAKKLLRLAEKPYPASFVITNPLGSAPRVRQMLVFANHPLKPHRCSGLRSMKGLHRSNGLQDATRKPATIQEPHHRDLEKRGRNLEP